MPRKESRHLVSTYVKKTLTRGGARYKARVIDGRTSRENRCSKDDPIEAASCAREKVLKKRRR